jgi:biotin operon repressor
MRRVAANRAAVNTRRPQLREWGRAVFSEDANYDALMRIYHRVIGKS